jgi:hypothetical protein
MRKQSKAQRVEAFLTSNPTASVAEVAKKFKTHPSLVYQVRKRMSAPAAPVMSANNHQEGGDHYTRMTIQPWDFIIDNRLGFLEGNIVKYVCRWQLKGGIEDLRKAAHYLTKLIESSEKTNAN